MTPSLSLTDRSDEALSAWLRELGVTNAPIPRENVRTALRFFAETMPRLAPGMALSFLRATDLSRQVRACDLRPPEKLLAFRRADEAKLKLFYTRSGASPQALGVNPAGRTAVHFKVKLPCRALESYSNGAIDTWSIPADGQALTIAPRAGTYGVMAGGGNIQLIVPDSPRYLILA